MSVNYRMTLMAIIQIHVTTICGYLATLSGTTEKSQERCSHGSAHNNDVARN
jgi:hypothetical protein